MQYVAPSIILMAGLGAAVLMARLPGPRRLAAAPTWVFGGLAAIGLGMMAWDATHPYMTPLDRDGRDFARRFWAEESSDAELVCARTDLHLPLDPLVWQGDRAAVYLCHQAIDSPRHRAKAPPRLDRVSASTRCASSSSARPGATRPSCPNGSVRMPADTRCERDASAS